MPVQSNSAEMLISRIEEIQGSPLSEQEVDDVVLWSKGRALQDVVMLYGWQVIQEMIKSYGDDAGEKLANTDPAKRDEVIAEHAVYYAATRLYRLLLEDVNRAVEAAQTTPQPLRVLARRPSSEPPPI